MATITQALPRRTIINTVAIFGGEIFARLATFAMALAIARRFGPEALGQYGYALAFASILLLIPDFGLHLLATRELAANPGQFRQTFWTLHWLKLPLVLAVVTFVVLFGGLAVRDDGRRMLLFILVARALLQTFSLASMAVFKAFEQMHHIALLQFTNALVVVAAAAFALELNLSLPTVVAAFLFGQAAETLSAWGIVRRNFNPGRPAKGDGRTMAGMMLAAVPIGFTSVLQAVNLRLDLLILSIFVPNHELGRFQAAAWFAIGAFLAASLAMTVLFPRLARWLRVGSPSATTFVTGLLKTALLLASCGSLFVGLGAPWLLRTVFGHALESADDLLRILAPALPFVVINVILFHVFVAAGCRKAYLRTLVCGLAVGVSVGLLLAPRYGANGSAVAALAREVVTSGMFLYFLWRERIAPDISKSVFKALMMATFVCVIVSSLAWSHVPRLVWPFTWSLLVLAAVLTFVGIPDRQQLRGLTEEDR